MTHEILVVDDQEDIRTMISDLLTDAGYATRTAADSQSALEMIRSHPPHLVILDIWLNDNRFDGIEVLDRIKQNFPNVLVVMISGHANIETAVSALQKGAYDFIEKPFQVDRLLSITAKALETSRLRRELREMKEKTVVVTALQGTSPKVQALHKLIDKVAVNNSRILIQGSPGVGKAIVARAIHHKSSRSGQPFVTINCATLDKDALSETLFGVEKNHGSLEFSVQLGVLEQVNGGTLYLDDVSDMPIEIQARMAQILQAQKFRRLDGSQDITVDLRVVSSTSKSLEQMISDGLFRQDLYYRLNVVPIQIPPLKERREDIIDLARVFLDDAMTAQGRSDIILSADARQVLKRYDWPGNARQLRNVMEWAVIMLPDLKKVITAAMLPSDIQSVHITNTADGTSLQRDNLINVPIREAREHFEREYIARHISRLGGNIAKTAEEIGMERTALHRKIKTLNISTKEDKS